MTILAVVGDCTTTTCVALAASWPVGDEVFVVEADRSGGSLIGWLDTPSAPSLTTIVATLGASPSAAAMDTIGPMTQRSASGVRFIAAPLRAAPARRAIDEAEAMIVRPLAAADAVALLDLGRSLDQSPPTFVRSAAAILVIHRQSAASTAAAAVRLERLSESMENLADVEAPIALAVIGDAPFAPADIAAHIASSVPDVSIDSIELADDTLAASVIAGRPGVSAKRLRRLPLMRSASDAANRLAQITCASAVAPAPTHEAGIRR